MKTASHDNKGELVTHIPLINPHADMHFLKLYIAQGTVVHISLIVLFPHSETADIWIRCKNHEFE